MPIQILISFADDEERSERETDDEAQKIAGAIRSFLEELYRMKGDQVNIDVREVGPTIQ